MTKEEIYMYVRTCAYMCVHVRTDRRAGRRVLLFGWAACCLCLKQLSNADSCS